MVKLLKLTASRAGMTNPPPRADAFVKHQITRLVSDNHEYLTMVATGLKGIGAINLAMSRENDGLEWIKIDFSDGRFWSS